MNIASKTSVLCTTVFGEGQLALLIGSESEICLEIVNINDKSSASSFLVRSPGIAEQPPNDICVIEWIPVEKVVDDFNSHWFREGREKSSFFIIGLPDGMILALFPNSGDIEYIYASTFPYLMSYWDFSSDPDCEEVKTCSLSLFTTNGGVVKLNEMGQVITNYFPLDNLKSVFLDGSLYLYISDWKQSCRLAISSKPQPSIYLPLKGILCWGGWGKQYTLALSKNGEFYCIDNTCEMKNIPEMLPESSHIAELSRKTAMLELINSRSSKLDSFLRAISLVNKNIQFSVSAQAAYVRRKEYTICLSIRSLINGITIEKENWLLAVTMCPDSSESVTGCHRLRQNLISSDKLTQLVTYELPCHPGSQLIVTVQLFYSQIPPFVTYLPIMFVGEVCMDPSNFILPATEIELSYNPTQPDLKDVLDDNNFDQNRVVEKEETKLHITLSEDFPIDAVFKNLLSKCKPLWRTSMWNDACAQKKIEFAIADQLVTVELTEGEVIISGKDSGSCYIMKHALFVTSPKGCRFKVNPSEALNHLETYQRSCELLMHMENIPTKNIQELHQLLRDNITSHLTP